MSVLNLLREKSYEQENTILVGLVPGPKEPDSMNSFINPLSLSYGVIGNQFNVATISCVKMIRAV